MGSYVGRKSPTRASAGVAVSPAVNLAEELRTVPWLLQKSLEGGVYIAGHGLEETATDSEASLDETTPTFVLMAPTSGTILVPIWAAVRMHAEGGAAPDLYLSYVGVDRVTTTTGTALEKLQIGGGATTSAAIALKTVSAVPAITSAQTVLLARRASILDNLISVEGATTAPNQETLSESELELSFDFWARFHGAFTLSGGKSIMVHTGTGTTDSTYSITFVWAELATSVYDHIT